MEPDPLDRVHGQDAGWGAAPLQKRLQQKKEQQAFRRIHLLHLHILHLHTRQVWVEDSAWAVGSVWAGAAVVAVGSVWAAEAVAVLVADSTADNRSETMRGRQRLSTHTFFIETKSLLLFYYF
jgi:hypothetical protein